MEFLIALLFVSFDEDGIKPKYSFGHCYIAPDAENRPNIIGIRHNDGIHYNYRIFYGRDQGWSDDFFGKVKTIESVYSKEIRCP